MANVELGSSNLKEVYDAINAKGDLDTSNLVTLNTPQDITSLKNFPNGLKVDKIYPAYGDSASTPYFGIEGYKATSDISFSALSNHSSISSTTESNHSNISLITKLNHSNINLTTKDSSSSINLTAEAGGSTIRLAAKTNTSKIILEAPDGEIYLGGENPTGQFILKMNLGNNGELSMDDKTKSEFNNKLCTFNYKHNYAPTLNVNPSSTGVTWHDTKENEIYVCIDNTLNNNKWVGNKSGYVGGSYVTANPGEAGFGCGVAPSEIVSKYNMTPMEGTYNPNSKNYGNYTDRTGSVMVWIPKVYVKYTYDTAEPYSGHKVEVSNTPKADYFLPRCFINNGKEIDGFFIDKYACSPENKIGVSKRYGQPLCIHPNGIDVLSNLELPADVVSALSLSNGTILNRADALPLAAKTRGVHYSLPTAFMFHHLADLVDAHYFATRTATDNFLGGDYSLCAWADIAPYAPKGPNNNNLTDYFDTNVVFQLSTNNNGNSYKTARCGSCDDSVFPKITHNGQWCGVADMNGVMWQGALGLISNASANICIMKESTNATNIVTSNLYDYSLYDEITSLSYYKTSVKGQNYYPTTGQLWSNETSRTTDVYKLQSVGFPSSLIAGQNNNERYGCDCVWLNYVRQQLFPYYLSCGWDSLRAGVRSLDFNYVLSHSLIPHGFRACIIPD